MTKRAGAAPERSHEDGVEERLKQLSTLLCRKKGKVGGPYFERTPAQVPPEALCPGERLGCLFRGELSLVLRSGFGTEPRCNLSKGPQGFPLAKGARCERHGRSAGLVEAEVPPAGQGVKDRGTAPRAEDLVAPFAVDERPAFGPSEERRPRVGERRPEQTVAEQARAGTGADQVRFLIVDAFPVGYT
jgi:hypothetical protein